MAGDIWYKYEKANAFGLELPKTSFGNKESL